MSDHTTKKSHLLTQEVAKRAVEFVLPAIQQLIETKVLKRGDLNIVIAIRPTYWDGDEIEWVRFEESIVYDYAHTDPSTWEFPFKEIAWHKCFQSWRSGMSTHEMQTRAPHLLEHGDTVYYGSVVQDGLIVACSGVQPYFDEMISAMVLAACRALCIQAREALGEGTGGFIR